MNIEDKIWKDIYTRYDVLWRIVTRRSSSHFPLLEFDLNSNIKYFLVNASSTWRLAPSWKNKYQDQLHIISFAITLHPLISLLILPLSEYCAHSLHPTFSYAISPTTVFFSNWIFGRRDFDDAISLALNSLHGTRDTHIQENFERYSIDTQSTACISCV